MINGAKSPPPDMWTPPEPKPCARRMKSADGGQMWCIQEENHVGDCRGVSARELDTFALEEFKTMTLRAKR